MGRRTDHARRLATRPIGILVVALALVPVTGLAASAAGTAHAGRVIEFGTAPAAPRSARASFAHNIVGGVPKGLQLAKLRQIGEEAFPGERLRLFVAPVAGGGFCYEWAFEPGDPGIWAAEEGGCSGRRPPPLMSSYDGTRVSILASRALVDSVSVKLSNGQAVGTNLLWVSAPISAGFLLYQPPAGLHVVELDALANGKVVEKDPIDQGMG